MQRSVIILVLFVIAVASVFTTAQVSPPGGTVTVSGTVSSNVAQVGGNAVNTGTGAAGSGTVRVVTATDSTIGTVTAVTAITNALPVGANVIGKVSIDQATPGTTNLVYIKDSSGNNITAVTDPCDGAAKTAFPISVSSATTTQLVAASASNKVYVCHIDLVVASANNIALVEDNDASCASPTAGMAGGTTAATGWNITGNGISFGNGSASVFQTAAVNRYVCIITSGTAQTSGNIMYVLAP